MFMQPLLKGTPLCSLQKNIATEKFQHRISVNEIQNKEAPTEW